MSNASLAVRLAQIFLQLKASIEPESPLPKPYIDGLQNVRWPGRCQTVPDPTLKKTTWFLDGAHTVESLDCCIQWFVSPGVGLTSKPSWWVVSQSNIFCHLIIAYSRRPIRILVFNITHGRSGSLFLGAMEATLAAQLESYGQDEDPQAFFDHVIFCTNITYANGGWKKGEY